MIKIPRFVAALCAAAFLAPSAAIAQDADTRAVQAYVLTDAGLAKFTEATKKLNALGASCKEEDDDDSDSQSIDQMVAKINATPGAQAAIQSVGLSTREYVLFSFSILQNAMAAWAVSQPGGKLPPGISQANVDFIKKHEAQFAAMDDKERCGEDLDESVTEE